MSFPEVTQRTLYVMVALIVVGAVSLATPLLDEAVVVGTAALLLVLVVDFLLAGSPRRVMLVRELPVRALQGERVEIRYVLSSTFGEQRVEITDTLHDAEPFWLVLNVVVQKGAVAVVPLSCELPLRGTAVFGRCAIRTRGPLGFVARRERRVMPGEIRVFPSLPEITKSARAVAKTLGSAARVPVRNLCEGREFDSLREYVVGDDFRALDWKASARRGRWIVRQLRPETNQDIILVLDAGRKSLGQFAGARAPKLSRFDVAVRAALAVANTAIDRGDRVGLLALTNDAPIGVVPNGKRAHLHTLGAALREVTPAPVETDFDVVKTWLLRHQRRRALVMVFTDLLDEPNVRRSASTMQAIAQRHLLRIVAIGDDYTNAVAREAIDDDEREAARVILMHRARASQALKAQGALVYDAFAHTALALSVRAYVDVKSTGRL